MGMGGVGTLQLYDVRCHVVISDTVDWRRGWLSSRRCTIGDACCKWRSPIPRDAAIAPRQGCPTRSVPHLDIPRAHELGRGLARGIEHCDQRGVDWARPVALIDGLGRRQLWVIERCGNEAVDKGQDA